MDRKADATKTLYMYLPFFGGIKILFFEKLVIIDD
jgi:hypothetical protein